MSVVFTIIAGFAWYAAYASARIASSSHATRSARGAD
jgi:hypothetical protein